MNLMKKSNQNPAACNCCEGVDVLTPARIFNRPGLNAIAYRAGTHGSFLETMKARLSSSAFPQLAALTTRDSRDASIALLDAWATAADVLTFYQERIANEGYLGTAIERRSILELARLVGYRLRPGLAASVYLSYTLEPTQDTTVIEIGNKAQSIPGPNEKPQVFETAEKLIAHQGLNLMKPRVSQPQIFNLNIESGPDVVFLRGVATNLRLNDGLLAEFALVGTDQPITPFYRAIEIKAEPELDRTTVKLWPKTVLMGPPPIPDSVLLMQSLTAICTKYRDLDAFGLSKKSKIVNRVTDRLLVLENLTAHGGVGPVTIAFQTLIPDLIDEYAFSTSRGYDNIAAWLAALIEELQGLEPETPQQSRPVPNTGLPSFVELFQPFKQPQSVQPSNEAQLTRPFAQIFSPRSELVAQMYGALQPQAAPFVKSVLANATPSRETTQSAKTVGLVTLLKIQALRLKASLAGRNLPTVIRETAGANGGIVSTRMAPPTLREYIAALALAIPQVKTSTELSWLALDAQYSQITADSKVVIERPAIGSGGLPGSLMTTTHTVIEVSTASLEFFGVSLVVTVLNLRRPWLSAAEIDMAAATNLITTSTTVFAQNEDLKAIDADLTDDLNFSEKDLNPVIELDGLYSSLEPGRWTVISGERVVTDTRTNQPINTGVEVSELVMVASVAHEAKTLINGELVAVKGEKLHTFLRPAQPPAYRYRRNTVRIYGNVVRATHGETRNEVLGSGDGSKELQSFELRQPPLTYLAAPNPSGTESTLEVRVNNIRWREAPNLFVLAPNDRNYITKIDDDGKTTVIYGDGEHGARLPTGSENITAVYRQGLGKDGNVKAGQIKLPLTKPLGVKGVINPISAGGGVDKETRDQARINAPIAVLALDRLVSVQDYADFARTFAGIAKASAQRLSDGVREVVHLTIAGVGNIPIDVTSDLYRNLVAALGRFGDPLQPLEVESFERVLLIVSAKVSLHPDYLWESVKEKMRASLWDQLDFDSRELGEGVTLSEVLSLMQAVAGVNYVDFELLDSVTEAKLNNPNFGAELTLKPRVNARLARMNEKKDDLLPAQLLFLSRDVPDTLILEEVAK
jgi:hypothetical protein